MAKTKKVEKKEPDKKELIASLLRKRIYEIFDRTPVGSLRDSEVAKLSEEISKL